MSIDHGANELVYLLIIVRETATQLQLQKK